LLLAYGWKRRQLFDAYVAAGAISFTPTLAIGGLQLRGDFGGLHKVVLDARCTSRIEKRNMARKERLVDAKGPEPLMTNLNSDAPGLVWRSR
jgi:hypothetical protein